MVLYQIASLLHVAFPKRSNPITTRFLYAWLDLLRLLYVKTKREKSGPNQKSSLPPQQRQESRVTSLLATTTLPNNDYASNDFAYGSRRPTVKPPKRITKEMQPRTEHIRKQRAIQETEIDKKEPAGTRDRYQTVAARPANHQANTRDRRAPDNDRTSSIPR